MKRDRGRIECTVRADRIASSRRMSHGAEARSPVTMTATAAATTTTKGTETARQSPGEGVGGAGQNGAYEQSAAYSREYVVKVSGAPSRDGAMALHETIPEAQKSR